MMLNIFLFLALLLALIQDAFAQSCTSYPGWFSEGIFLKEEFPCSLTTNCDWTSFTNVPATDACCECGGGTVVPIEIDPKDFTEWSGHFYKLVSPGPGIRLNWYQANALAQAHELNGHKGHLVSITSPEEQTIVEGLVANIGTNLVTSDWDLENGNTIELSNSAWIGLHDRPTEGEMEWVTGEDYNHSAALEYGWKGQPPQNYAQDFGQYQFYNDWNGIDREQYNQWKSYAHYEDLWEEDCVEIFNNGTWNDNTCQEPEFYYIVEIDPVPAVVVPSIAPTTTAPSTKSPTPVKPITTVPTTAVPNTITPTLRVPTTKTPAVSPTQMPTTAVSTVSPTKSPTEETITTLTSSPTIPLTTTTTTMSPTTISPRFFRLRNMIGNIPIIGPALLNLFDFLNIFN